MSAQERWVVTWYVLTGWGPYRAARHDYEVDPDVDLAECTEVVNSEADAKRRARAVVKSGVTFYGAATVERQVKKAWLTVGHIWLTDGENETTFDDLERDIDLAESLGEAQREKTL